MTAVLQKRNKGYSELHSPVSYQPREKTFRPRMPEPRYDTFVESKPDSTDKKSYNWLSDIFGSLYKVVFIVTGTTRTAVKVMQKKTPSMKNLRRLQAKAFETMNMDGKTWAKAFLAVLLIFFSTIAFYFFVHALNSVGTSTVVHKSTSGQPQAQTHFEKMVAMFGPKYTQAVEEQLDELVHDVMQLAVEESVVALEDALHRGIQTHCLPYIPESIKLGKEGLTQLDSEIILLLDLIATNRVALKDYHSHDQVLVVESSGKLSFVQAEEWNKHKETTDEAAVCPLVTTLFEYTQSKSHIPLPSKPKHLLTDGNSETEEADVMTAAEFVAMIDDDDGTITGDAHALVFALLSALSSQGECGDTGKALGLADTPAQMSMTPGLRKVVQETVAVVNSHESLKSTVHVNAIGELLFGDNKPKKSTQCDELAAILADQFRIKGKKRVKAASLSLLAHLYNVADGESVSALTKLTGPIPSAAQKTVSSNQKQQEEQKKVESKKTKDYSKNDAKTAERKKIFAKKEQPQRKKANNSASVYEIAALVQEVTGDKRTADIFVENAIDGALFTELTDGVLKNELEINQWGLRQKILQAVKTS